MTPEPIPEEDEEEIDPVVAVARAVDSVDRTEFDDGHELKQLIKDVNGVTLPDAGKFLLQALRSEDAPVRREDDVFVQTDIGGGASETTEDETVVKSKTRAETEEDAEGRGDTSRLEDTPDALRKAKVWGVREDGDVSRMYSLDEAVEDSDGGEIGYVDVATVDIRSIDGDEVDDRLPDPPFDDVYVETHPDGDGWRVPVIGYEQPDWWSEAGEAVSVKLSTEEFRVSTGEPVRNGRLMSGGRELDEWLADVLRSTGGSPFDDPPDEVPDIDSETVTPETVEEALEHVDPDIPYPDWRRIGAALVDGFGDVDKARNVFDGWSRKGSRYGDRSAERVRGVEAYADEEDVDIGYLVHEACLEGWVWEADGNDEEPNKEKKVATGVSEDGVRGVVETGSWRREGELVERDGGYGYVTDDGFERVTNFTLGAERRVRTEESRQLRLSVKADEENYEVTIEPETFNSVERFEESVATGFTTWFDGEERDLDSIRGKVGAGGTVDGVKAAGLYPETGEFVTPVGTLTQDGWTDNPDTVFFGNGVGGRWDVEAGCGTRTDGVSKVLKLVPGMHGSGRFLTVVGWFYAAPLKPFIVERADYFPSLWLTGEVEESKPCVRILNRAFGTDGEGLRLGTGSRVFDALAASRSVPVRYDGYSTELDRDVLKFFHNCCAKTTRCARTADDERVTAPVVVTGEGPDDATVSRRSVDVELTKGDGISESYAELVGTSYYDGEEVRQPDGADLEGHATAYYSWIAGQEKKRLAEVWDDCLSSAEDVLQSRDTEIETAELHNIRVTLFGLRNYQRFAEEIGAEPAIDAGSGTTKKEEVMRASSNVDE